MDEPSAEYDSPWKEVLELYFREFLAFFFPAVHDGIDWSEPPEFLDKELQQITPESAVGLRVVDKLVRVRLLEGKVAWILIHIEIQAQVRGDFRERMYIYSYRAFDCRHHEVVSLAVLGDDDPDWRPSEFAYRHWGCEVRLKFPMVKLLDYEAPEEWRKLEKSTNPCAVFIMAHLKTLRTHGDPPSRKQWKVRLVRDLFQRGWSQTDVRRVFRFIDWMMTLPDELRRSFWLDVDRLQEEQKVAYITETERLWMEDGRTKGIEEGARDIAQQLLLDVLRVRFGRVPDPLLQGIKRIEDPSQLSQLHLRALEAPSLDAIRSEIPA